MRVGAVLALRVETLYLDNVDHAYAGTLFEHDQDYLERAYTKEVDP